MFRWLFKHKISDDELWQRVRASDPYRDVEVPSPQVTPQELIARDAAMTDEERAQHAKEYGW